MSKSEIRVSERGLRETLKTLTDLENVHLEEDGEVPEWLRVARLCVESKLEEVQDDG